MRGPKREGEPKRWIEQVCTFSYLPIGILTDTPADAKLAMVDRTDGGMFFIVCRVQGKRSGENLDTFTGEVRHDLEQRFSPASAETPGN